MNNIKFFKEILHKGFYEYLYCLANDIEVETVLQSYFEVFLSADNVIEFDKIMSKLVDIVKACLEFDNLRMRYMAYPIENYNDYYKMWILENLFELSSDYSFVILNGGFTNPS